jgi:hypothetical protein
MPNAWLDGRDLLHCGYETSFPVFADPPDTLCAAQAGPVNSRDPLRARTAAKKKDFATLHLDTGFVYYIHVGLPHE